MSLSTSGHRVTAPRDGQELCIQGWGASQSGLGETHFLGKIWGKGGTAPLIHLHSDRSKSRLPDQVDRTTLDWVLFLLTYNNVVQR